MSIEKHILIIDDNVGLCYSLRNIFKDEGYRVRLAHTGAEGLAVLHEEPADVSLLDIHLPDVQGIELLPGIHKLQPDMPVIVITAYASLETAVQALHMGAFAYVLKPLDIDEVLVVVRRALEKLHLVQQERRLTEQLRALNQAALAMTSELDPDRVMQTITDLARELVGAAYAALTVPGEGGGIARIYAAGLTEEQQAALSDLPWGQGLLSHVLCQAKSTRIDNLHQHPQFTDHSPHLPAMISFLGVPIVLRGSVPCALYLADKANRRQSIADRLQPGSVEVFSEEDQQVVETLAAQAAVAIENAHLYEAERQWAADLMRAGEQLEQELAERVRAEAEIARLQRLLQNIADSMPSVLVTLDPAGRVLTWNPAAETLTGRPADQVQGQSLWEVCPALARYRDMVEQVSRERQVAHRHKEQLATGDRVIYLDVSVFPLVADEPDSTEPVLRPPKGGVPKDSLHIEGAVLRIDDVTQRVQLEEMMLQSAKLASVGGLAAGVAHEINNPLTMIIQSAQMLQMAFDTQRSRTRERLQACSVDPEGLGRYLEERGLTEYLDGIRSAGARAAKIVSDLLNFSRKTSSQPAPHDLNALVEQALDLASADYDPKKKYDFRDIEIVRELAPGLPHVICDGQQIQQVVLNLVRNAAQAIADSEWRIANGEYRPRLTLRTSLRWAQDEAIRSPKSEIRNRVFRLEVEDNGPGIPEAVRARLFEPFFTTKDVGEGTGLGLWLCWSIVVEHHGGRIWAEQVTEGGTCFVVELPVGSDQ